MQALLHGSYYGYNFGDTLLCRLFAGWLQEAGASVFLPLASRRNTALIGGTGRGLMTIPSAKAMLLCGGGYFSQPSSSLRKWTARAYLRHIFLARHAGRSKPYSILGVGAGPISSGHLQKSIRDVFDRAHTVIVRDEESHAFLQSIGVQRPVSVAVDAVVTATPDELAAPMPPDPALQGFYDRHETLVALHVSAHPSGSELAVMRSALDWMLENTDAGIILANDSVPRIKGSEWSRHISVADKFCDRIYRHTYSGEPSDLIGILRKADLAVTTKLHVGIVRCAFHKPVISVPSHSKTVRFYRQMDLQDWCIAGQDDRTRRLLEQLKAWLDGHRPDHAVFEARRMPGLYRRAVRDFVTQVNGDH